MKKRSFLKMLALPCAIASLAFAGVNASALSIGDDHTLGTFIPGEPAGDAVETAMVQHLVDLYNGDSTDLNFSGRVFNLIGGSAIPAPDLPDAVFGEKEDREEDETTVDVTGYTYLLGKYDGPNGGSVVWYVGDLTGEITIDSKMITPSKPNGVGLSHIVLYSPGGTSVPDGGLTAVLFGLSLIGLTAAARKRS